MAGVHPFSALAGTWRGGGRGEYPTIASFSYSEELVVMAVPDRPLAHWRSTTRDAESGEPRHAESGFLRSVGDGVELVVAHGFGIVETAAGTFDGAVLDLTSTGLLGTASAKRVDAVERSYRLDGATIAYTVAMATAGLPLTHHLAASLARDS